MDSYGLTQLCTEPTHSNHEGKPNSLLDLVFTNGSPEADPHGGVGDARPHLAQKKVVDLLLRACTWHAAGECSVREQRLVNARTSVSHADSSIVSDVYPCLA